MLTLAALATAAGSALAARGQAFPALLAPTPLSVQPQHRRSTRQDPSGSSNAHWSDIWWSGALGNYASDSSDREANLPP